MEFFPHILLFVPICVFAALFATAAAVNIVINASARKQAARPTPRRRATPRPSAQIIYFRPRKTFIPAGLNAGLR